MEHDDNTKTLTKADIIEAVYEKVGFSKKEASDIVELLFDTLKTTLENGEKVKISGFGNFVVSLLLTNLQTYSNNSKTYITRASEQN